MAKTIAYAYTARVLLAEQFRSSVLHLELADSLTLLPCSVTMLSAVLFYIPSFQFSTCTAHWLIIFTVTAECKIVA